MKKVVAIVAVLVLSFGLFACSKQPDQTGKASSMGNFTSVDIDGNAVNQSIFEGHKLTMVNVWGTFCSPCIMEMPDLGEINREYADKGFQIVGIIIDAVDGKGNTLDKIIGSAKTIIGKTQADYLHILPSPSLNEAKLNAITGYPTTFFVDEKGNPVGKTYLGANEKEDWVAIVDNLLKEVK